ncbi:MAG: Gfo/Idh/MocA family oxidoreductase [Candidatus Sulfotelmatobacter sp.]|jgi:predicted dehydrogenase
MSSASVLFDQYSVLVVGAGSIGRRHMANLRGLGVRKLAATDTDAARLQTVIDELGARGFADLDEALRIFQPNVVFICTPPAFHIDQAWSALRSGADIFVEKPLSHLLDGVAAFKAEADKLGRVVQVGYNLRFNPGIQTLRRLVDEGVAGRILWARAEVAQYLPDWRPWQDYRQSYTARHELGGGVILDASHEIDYMLWLLGPPRELTCMAGQVSGLDLNVEDCATILLRLRSGAQADIHMDFAQRTSSRSCVVAGDRARLEWEHAKNQVRITRPQGPPEVINYEFESNQMYVAEVRSFFSCVQERVIANQSLVEAELTLKVALGALTSAAQQKWVRFEP